VLDSSKPDIAIIIQAILQARDIVGRHSWGSPQEPIDDCWWADVLADPRTRTRRQSRGFDHVDGKPAAQRAYYTLADEPRPTISVACTKCEWKADFSRAELITMYGLIIRYRTCSIILLRLPARRWETSGTAVERITSTRLGDPLLDWTAADRRSAVQVVPQIAAAVGGIIPQAPV
jgi:hypothetical protein